MVLLNSSALESWDWVAIALYFVVVLGIGLYFMKRAGKSTEDFFLAGRSLPWWIAGTSMVATMFAADTPLFHTGNVRRFGLDAAWLFFGPGFGIVLGSVLFTRLWRRAHVVTEIEVIEMRYSGEAAPVFRGFSAWYGGVFEAALTMGWVTLAMGVVIEEFLGIDRKVGTWIFLAIVLFYSVGSGMWGVVMTDVFQYLVATFGSIFLAWKAVAACGGLKAMNASLAEATEWTGVTEGAVRVLPDVTAWNPNYTWWLIIAWVTIYSLQVSTTRGFLGQRIYACRDEKHASRSILWFGFCYYVLNGWPWLITGAASIVILGATNEAAGLADYQLTFPAMIKELMPIGLRGLMVASLIAAFMSTIDTLLNWGSSYIVNDFYKRFYAKDKSTRHYVMVSRACMVALAVFGGWFALQFETLTEMLLTVFKYLTGGIIVYLLRWLWSRTNIWSEIAAMAGSIVVAFIVDKVLPGQFGIWKSEDNFQFWGQQMLTISACTTLIWIVVTLLTKPVSDDVLIAFYKRVRPPGPGWARIRRLCGDDCPEPESLSRVFAVWVAGVTALYSLLAGIGFWLTCRWGLAAGLVVVSVVAAVAYFKLFASLSDLTSEHSQEKA